MPTVKDTACRVGQHRCYDLVGIGFGPSNLALAIALASTTHAPAARGDHALLPRAAAALRLAPRHAASTTPPCRCRSSRTWSRCATRPASSASCPTCTSAGRLVDFINHKTLFPLRVEFHDYFEWAAAQVDDMVALRPRGRRRRARSSADGVVDVLRRDRPARRTAPRPSTGPATSSSAPGCDPHLPDGRRARSDRVWHNSRTAAAGRASSTGHGARAGSSSSAPGRAPPRSTALPAPTASPTPRSARSSPATATAPPTTAPFANRIFDPDAVDEFFAAPRGRQADAARLPRATPTTRWSTST